MKNSFIKLNNRPYPFKAGMTVTSIMKDNNYDFPSIIVKINGELIDEESWKIATVSANDNVEIIHLFGGG